MKLPKFIKNIYISGFPSEGLISAFVDEGAEIDYKKFRSNSNIFNNPLVRIRISFAERPSEIMVDGCFGQKSLRVREESCKAPGEGETDVDADNDYIFTSKLYRGRNVFIISGPNDEKWELVVFHKSLFRDWTEGLARAVILIVGLNTFIIQGSYIPSASMMNTLMEGDYIWVNKAAYFLQSPSRGDIVVFNFPLDPTRDFIKRLIGLPGDKISIKNKTLFLNGVPHREKFTMNDYLIREVYSDELFGNSRELRLPQGYVMVTWEGEVFFPKLAYFARNINAERQDGLDLKVREKGMSRYRHPLHIVADAGDTVRLSDEGISVDGILYGSGQYKIFETVSMDFEGPALETPEFIVPEDMYFVMGDNRDNSQDSRYWGFVPKSYMKGRAFFLYWPLDRMKLLRSEFGTTQ
jgi:signal peptidase I